MSSDEKEDETIHRVAVNHDEQSSIGPADQENAIGWRNIGKSDPRNESLAHIKDVWTDTRPFSLRKRGGAR
jgi:MbtH protein